MGTATLGAVRRAVLARLLVVVRLAITALIGGRKAALRSDRLHYPRELDGHDRKRNRDKGPPRRTLAPVGRTCDRHTQVHRIRSRFEARAATLERQARKSDKKEDVGGAQWACISRPSCSWGPDAVVRLPGLVGRINVNDGSCEELTDPFLPARALYLANGEPDDDKHSGSCPGPARSRRSGRRWHAGPRHPRRRGRQRNRSATSRLPEEGGQQGGVCTLRDRAQTGREARCMAQVCGKARCRSRRASSR